MTGPDVSVVIAAYNAAETIERAIRSALAQQGVIVEVIVADDCSTDATRATVATLGDPAVRLVALERNRGPGGARNAGFTAACGRWIAVLDADDTMQPDRLCRMISAAERDDAALAVDNLFVLDTDGRIDTMFPDDLLACTPQITLADFIDSNRIFRSTHNFGYMKPVFRRAFLEDNDLLYDEALRIGEDYLLFAGALAAGGRCVVTPVPGYVYHIREGSISRVLHLHHVEAMLAGDRRFLARFPLTGEAAAAQRRRTRNLQETRAFLALVQHLKNRSFGHALKVALGDPVALRHLAMPVAARWRRLVTPSHRTTAALRAASSPATAQDYALENKG
ncbi:glycosyltransferase family 2 protein [Shinella sp. WSJ-2]|uniref:glycosyltransferase family 2 protein n=1 Tax=Shinella sp. WSJ-2 TaxID=2303749 RepID=UPI000E3CD58F|nr:glycosyltransferase family 2 protein [Shinella sp. WSJ-2]RFZ87425.1 glycosyltransferase family 2 protein [Shinella sp. WSJ-2]